MYDQTNLDRDIKSGLVKEVFVLSKYHFDKIPENISKEFDYIGRPVVSAKNRSLIYLKANGFTDVLYRRCYVLLIKNNAPGTYAEIVKKIEHEQDEDMLKRKITGIRNSLDRNRISDRMCLENMISYLSSLEQQYKKLTGKEFIYQVPSQALHSAQ